MSLPKQGAGSSPQRPAPPSKHKWIFSKEEMRNAASLQEGMSREEEMTHRQLAAAFIQEMIDGLNLIKDPRMKIGHTVLCVAHIYMHRFYYWHSFKKLDYRDVGAACVLMAGKSHECPRKLSHVVSVWRNKTGKKELQTDTGLQARTEASQIIVLLESMVLQTISFDLNVGLPHTMVLKIRNTLDKEETHKSLWSCAYYFATDVIAVTDWTLRYSPEAMSIAIVHLMSAYANVRIEDLYKASVENSYEKPWFAFFDESMTDEKLREMEKDFLSTYRSTCTFHYASKFNFRIENRQPPPLPQPVQQQVEIVERKMEVREAQSHSPIVSSAPDSTQNGIRPRGYVPKDELTVERLNKERLHEEERRKRDHDRMSGKIDNSSSFSSEKRARIGPLSTNFVSSSLTHSNGKNSQNTPTTLTSIASVTTTTQKHKKPLENSISSSNSPIFRPSARAFDVAPILTPPAAPKMESGDHSDMDLEDGELE